MQLLLIESLSPYAFVDVSTAIARKSPSGTADTGGRSDPRDRDKSSVSLGQLQSHTAVNNEL